MHRTLLYIFCLVAGAVTALRAEQSPTVTPPTPEVLISVADQKLALLYDGGLVGRYRISTSRFGIGDSFYSYKTPEGRLRVCDKIGNSLPPGTVIRKRSATGEVLPVNAPGRDPIVTRILWLEGLEAQNHNARSRAIYIHGTPQEQTLGEPKSWGCIRMSSNDVMALFDKVPVGTTVTILPGHLPHLDKYEPPKPPEPILVASNKPAPTPAPAPAVQKSTPQPASHPTPAVAKKSSPPAVVGPAVAAATPAKEEVPRESVGSTNSKALHA